MLEHIFRAVMQLTAAAFAGVCLYIAFAQHPVRMALPPAAALKDFRAVIPRAEKLQAPLLITSLVAVAGFLVVTPRWSVAVGGVLLTAVLVLTLVAVLPINRRLLAGEPPDHLAQSEAALSRWGRLHVARTAVAVVGAIALFL